MRMRRPVILGSSVIAAVVGWFVCVDWSWFREECPHCGFTRDVLQYRLLTLPIHERTLDTPTVTQQIAAELNVPCQHAGLKRWHKHRRWGLWYCASPCINGLYSIDDVSSLDVNAISRLRILAEKNPNLGIEFHERAIQGHDHNFESELVRQIFLENNNEPESEHKQ